MIGQNAAKFRDVAPFFSSRQIDMDTPLLPSSLKRGLKPHISHPIHEPTVSRIKINICLKKFTQAQFCK